MDAGHSGVSYQALQDEVGGVGVGGGRGGRAMRADAGSVSSTPRASVSRSIASASAPGPASASASAASASAASTPGLASTILSWCAPRRAGPNPLVPPTDDTHLVLRLTRVLALSQLLLSAFLLYLEEWAMGSAGTLVALLTCYAVRDREGYSMTTFVRLAATQLLLFAATLVLGILVVLNVIERPTAIGITNTDSESFAAYAFFPALACMLMLSLAAFVLVLRIYLSLRAVIQEMFVSLTRGVGNYAAVGVGGGVPMRM